ncbi:hypothetical protein FTO70_09060 [Methanosarcina sp. KYL-1]|uniref:hypothetical protein n=1 Tax=Methanosarcina sp. KYL-1 TaxID=2602068 RepID=UPI002101A5D7|nr:hypothetical protein [Methanosarcina sp. KYL-1]MCQ1535823.1 hypothetical protein [Methanosarcina sp. KYL-1]
MKSGELFAVISAVILIGIIALNVIPVHDFPGNERDEAGLELNISASGAIKNVANDSIASTYISEHFRVPEWRVVKTTLIRNTAYDLNGSTVREGEDVWKVEILERTCACAGVNTLYVIEGYVSADTGEVLNVSTKMASEENYERTTCSATSCH